MRVRFSAELWEYPGDGAWHFVTVPADLGEDLRQRSGPRRGFGSVRVRVTVGGSTWATSIFPSRTDGYLLPVKKAVRVAEGIDAGDPVDVTLELADTATWTT